ncbi:MAG: hypothetical protein AAGF85_11460 [Bacteroidota bacterium]
MDQSELKKDPSEKNQTPEWLKLVQINSWEAELLISALLLYMLFQLPEFIDNYKGQHYPQGLINIIFDVFIIALKVLRIGYSIHIIARGIWVASVGLSSIYPKSLDPKKLNFKNRFKKEIEEDMRLEQTIKGLEKIASLSYAVSFMLSGMMISAGLLFFYMLVWTELVITPSVRNGNNLMMGLGIFVICLYFALILILFIDFITNGFFRRESWASKPFYYVALIFRFLTLSFIFNRIYLAIISNLPKWQAHLVPILSVAILIGYKFLEDKIGDWDEERYLETAFVAVNSANYENLRNEDDPMFATIHSDVIYDGVLRLFVDTHGRISRLYLWDDAYDRRRWDEIDNSEQAQFARKFVKVKVDDISYDSLDWLDYVHPDTYDKGFLNYVDVSGFSKGLHTIVVELDTANFNDLQKRLIREWDPPIIQYARINFYKAH